MPLGDVGSDKGQDLDSDAASMVDALTLAMDLDPAATEMLQLEEKEDTDAETLVMSPPKPLSVKGVASDGYVSDGDGTVYFQSPDPDPKRLSPDGDATVYYKSPAEPGQPGEALEETLEEMN